MISDADDIQSVNPSLPGNVGTEKPIQRFDLCQKNDEDLLICIKQFGRPNFDLRNFHRRNCKELLDSMRWQGYDYSLGMKSVIFTWFQPSWCNSRPSHGHGIGQRVKCDGFNQNSLMTCTDTPRLISWERLARNGEMQATSVCIYLWVKT